MLSNWLRLQGSKMEGIFNYERDDSEDYYQILGCNESSTVSDILTEHADQPFGNPNQVNSKR